MLPPKTTATIFVPSADIATASQFVSLGEFLRVQLFPKSDETYIGPFNATATNWLPSAEQAMDDHTCCGILFEIHVAPESVDVKIGPGAVKLKPSIPRPAAANLTPSAEEATYVQCSSGRLFATQENP